jgi:hypothetical protein
MAEPHDDAAQFATLLQELTARSMGDQVRAMQRYRELLQDLAAGRVDPAALRARYDRLLGEQSAQLARDVSELGMRYYQSMLDLNRAYVDRLFDELAVSAGGAARPASDGGDAAPPPPPPPAQAVELTLTGRAGEDATASFVVENKRQEPADVIFLVSDFAAVDEPAAAFRPQLDVTPPRFRLDPHEERDVALRIPLDPEQFAPGRSYRGQVLVRSNDDLTLEVSVEVEE